MPHDDDGTGTLRVSPPFNSGPPKDPLARRVSIRRQGGTGTNNRAVDDPVPDCVTVKNCPAAVIVPVRDKIPVFSEMKKVTVPLPVPAVPLMMVSQLTLLTAVQLHPVAALILNDPLGVVRVTVRDVTGKPKTHPPEV